MKGLRETRLDNHKATWKRSDLHKLILDLMAMPDEPGVRKRGREYLRDYHYAQDGETTSDTESKRLRRL